MSITAIVSYLQKNTNRAIAHSIPLFFCLVSLQNIQEFFYHLHPNFYISWAVGLALGFGLLYQAWKLSEMDFDLTDQSYMTVLVTTVLFALISGGIQAAAYSAYMGKFGGIVIGMALPIVGELGVALSIAAHAKKMRAGHVANMQTELNSELRILMFNTVRELPQDALRDTVRAGAIDFAKELIAHTNAAMIADLRGYTLVSNTPPALVDNGDFGGDEAKINSDLGESDNGPALLTQANQARAEKTQQRQAALYDILDTELHGKPIEVLNKTVLGNRLGVTRQTIDKDLDALCSAGKLHLNGVVEVLK